ncbi:VOC family protein [Streptomyces sp. TG1A-60]|uniref:VOC family protein n=1 Tax=Streptomyces sp. TG1A-60 TaxID=3129111 RepID=UPI0030D220DB
MRGGGQAPAHHRRLLEPPAADPDISPADRETIAALLAKGVLRGVNFTTTDCDALYTRVDVSGADVLRAPIDQPCGVRDCAFRDPAGNMLRFTQRRN